MITVTCPRCGNNHHSDEVHIGKFLKCAKCGDSVQIGTKPENQIEAFEAKANVRSKTITQGFGLRLRQRILKGKRLASIYAILLAVVMSLVWYLYPSRPDIFDSASVPHEPAELNTSDPYASIATATPLPVSDHVTGDVMTPESPARGRGRLTLINGTREDGVVLMVSKAGDIARSVYISAGRTGTIDGVAVGNYWIRATLGNGWSDAGNTFIEGDSYFTFPYPYGFSEETIGDEIQSDRISLTLHEVPNGNIHKRSISKAQFWNSTEIAR